MKVNVKAKVKGAALVEFALVAVIFFTVLFSIIEFGYLFWGNLSMQHAVREGSRYAVVTGPSSFSAPTPQDLRTQEVKRCDAIKDKINANSMGFYDKCKVNGVDPTSFRTINDAGNVVDLGSGSAGCGIAEKIIVIHIDCALPLITPFSQLLSLLGTSIFTDGKYKFAVSTAMRNEAIQ